jgi:ubiquinone/menaquinone biosynthesis C-methylase UbiE
MSSPTPEQFKQIQKQAWDTAAEGWKKWWPIFESGAQKLSDRLVELAGIKQGDTVVDLGTGTGEPAVTAAKRVRPAGKVLAIDISAKMLSIAKERAKEHGLENTVELREGDAESVALQKNAFNAILSRWGLMFLPNLQESLKSVREALVPGGRIAAAVWTEPEKAPTVSMPIGVARKVLGLPPMPANMPPFNLADAKMLERVFAGAGFKNFRAEKMTLTFTFGSADEYSRFHMEINGPLIALLADKPREKREEVLNAIRDAAAKYAGPEGKIKMDNETMCVVAERG